MEIFISKLKVIKGFLLGMLMISAALFVVVKVFYILFPANRSVLDSSFNFQIIPIIVGLAAIIGIFIFGAMTTIIISRLFDSKPQLIISTEGIEDKRLGTGLIEWNEIGHVVQMENKHGQWLELELNTPEKYYRRLSKFQLFLRRANGQKGSNNLRILFADLDTPIDEAWQFIEENVIKSGKAKGMALMP